MVMKKHRWLLIILLSLFLVLLGTFSSAIATNAGEWTTFRCDANRSGSTIDVDSTNSAKQLWNYSTNAAVWSSPAVSNGLVLVGCKDCKIYCLNAADGKLVWNYSVANEVNSSPAIADGYVFVGCYDGWVYCMNISTGMPVWISKADGAILSSPAVVDSRVFIGSGKHDVYCFNASNGNSMWIFPTNSPVNSSPAVFDGVVYVACDDFFVYALNASTGKELWRHHTGSNLNSPCLYNGCTYIGSYDGYVVCLKASTGDEVWRAQTQDTVASSAAAANGCIYIGSNDNSIYCFNASTGEKIWQTPTGYWIWSSPTVADGNVYVGSQDYHLYCLNAFTGEIKWAYKTRNNVDSSPTIVNNTLYVGSSDYHVYAFTLTNSTNEALNPLPVTQTAWGTFLFDDIACAIGILLAFGALRFVYSSRQNKKTQNQPISPNEKQSWFATYATALLALVIVVFAVAFFVSLGSGPLWAADEKTYCQMAFHMVKSGNYLLPWSLGEPAIWAGKPPMLMWLMSLAYQAFGVNNFATRFWNPIFGSMSLVVMFYLGKKLFNPTVGFLSTLVLGTFTTFFAFATHAMTDGLLVFFILASIYFLLASEEIKNKNLYPVLSGLFFGLALMTKQIEALLIPLIIIIYLAIMNKTLRFLFTKWFAYFFGIALIVFAPYVVYMNFTYRDFWNCYFLYSTILRTVTPLEGHAGSYIFYFNFLATSENLLWMLLLPFAVGLCAFNSVVKRHKSDILILIWMTVVLGVFTLAQTKLYWYILPALPAFAIAISNLIYQLACKLQLHKPKTTQVNA
jgi:outer membrane protein assembly factor BamB